MTPPFVSIITVAICDCVLVITIRENNIKILFTNASQEEQSTLQFYAAKLSSNSFVFFAVKKMQKEILSARK